MVFFLLKSISRGVCFLRERTSWILGRKRAGCKPESTLSVEKMGKGLAHRGMRELV
jgi:hypothetical protein